MPLLNSLSLKSFALSLTAALAVSACTTVPPQIEGTFSDITPARVDPAVFGRSVRWGGVILSTEAKNGQTCMEILSHNLDKYLRPKQEDYTAGRYIACKPGFQDPMVFTAGREVTTTGTIRNIEMRLVEDFNYRYPVLDVDNLVLWEKRRKVIVYRGFNDPWYYGGYRNYPYWGWGPYYRPFPNTGYAEERTLRPDPSIVESGDKVDRNSRE